MEAELDALEIRVQQFSRLCQQLRAENHALRQELAEAHSESRALEDRLELAAVRVEDLLARLPDPDNE